MRVKRTTIAQDLPRALCSSGAGHSGCGLAACTAQPAAARGGAEGAPPGGGADGGTGSCRVEGAAAPAVKASPISLWATTIPRASRCTRDHRGLPAEVPEHMVD